jgi:Na+/proline symporter
MQLTVIDLIVIALYFAINLAVALFLRKRATKSVSDFFISGRNVSWWLAGTSMVATTFAADTPLVVTGLVARNGIAGNWIWWSMAFSGMLTVFFFAKLWRRAGVLTDVEFAEIRYSGKPATFLRWFRAVYLGLPINLIILGWVNLAIVKIMMLVLGVSKVEALVIAIAIMFITASISTLSGLWGVLWTDLFQFVLKMGMVILLAVFAINATGGMNSMVTQLHKIDETRGSQGSVLSFVPDINSAWMPLITFFVFIAVNWWASWYPGAEPGGGGYVAQRIFSAKNEKHSLLATLWFNIAHYAIRPWPWILVGLVAVVRYQHDSAFQADPESGYIRILIADLPAYLRGLMLAAFAAAYMSTIGTQLNWGASYLVNDVYRRFWRAKQKRETLCHRLAGHYNAADDSFCHRHILYGFNRQRVEIFDGGRRGNRPRVYPPLVLVAHQCMERNLGDGRGIRRIDDTSIRLSSQRKRAERIRVSSSHHCFGNDSRLAFSDISDPTRTPGKITLLLPPRPAQCNNVETDSSRSNRHRSSKGWYLQSCELDQRRHYDLCVPFRNGKNNFRKHAYGDCPSHRRVHFWRDYLSQNQ